MGSEDISLERAVFNLYVHYACRALLGGGKGQFVMEQLKRDEPALFESVMLAAKEVMLSGEGIKLNGSWLKNSMKRREN